LGISIYTHLYPISTRIQENIHLHPFIAIQYPIKNGKESYYLALRQTQTTIRTEAPNWRPWLLFFMRALQREHGASPNALKATFTSLVEKGLLVRHGAGRSIWYGLP
jgi:hypothetical protein